MGSSLTDKYVMNIYNTTVVYFNVIYYGYDCGVTIDLVNTKANLLQVCDKPYQTNKITVQRGDKIDVLRNCALVLRHINT